MINPFRAEIGILEFPREEEKKSPLRCDKTSTLGKRVRTGGGGVGVEEEGVRIVGE